MHRRDANVYGLADYDHAGRDNAYPPPRCSFYDRARRLSPDPPWRLAGRRGTQRRGRRRWSAEPF